MAFPTGAGQGELSREHQERVFRIGAGIGLAIVKRVFDRMGARIGVESEVGSRTGFWVEWNRRGRGGGQFSAGPWRG